MIFKTYSQHYAMVDSVMLTTYLCKMVLVGGSWWGMKRMM